MGAQLKEEYVSVAGFWEMEAKSELRHEYLNGRVYAMAGGTPNHSNVIFALSTAIGSRLRSDSTTVEAIPQKMKASFLGFDFLWN